MFSTASTYGLPRSKSITPEEMTRIVTYAKEHDPQLYVFCTIGSGLGLRLCEIVHIKTFDFVDGQLQVVRDHQQSAASVAEAPEHSHEFGGPQPRIPLIEDDDALAQQVIDCGLQALSHPETQQRRVAGSVSAFAHRTASITAAS